MANSLCVLCQLGFAWPQGHWQVQGLFDRGDDPEHQWRDWTHSPFVLSTILIGEMERLPLGERHWQKSHNTWVRDPGRIRKVNLVSASHRAAKPRSALGSKTSDDFKRLTWIGLLLQQGDKDIHFYLDDISIGRKCRLGSFQIKRRTNLKTLSSF